MISNRNIYLILFFVSLVIFISLNLTINYTISNKTAFNINFYIFGGLVILISLIWFGAVWKPKRAFSKMKNPDEISAMNMRRLGITDFEEYKTAELYRGKRILHISLIVAVANLVSLLGLLGG